MTKSADLVTFTEGILNGKFNFLCTEGGFTSCLKVTKQLKALGSLGN